MRALSVESRPGSLCRQQKRSLTRTGCRKGGSGALPAVPTLAESGVAAAPLITAHFVLGPPRLPAEIVERLAAAVRQAAQTADFRQ
ncbi:MAG TPA: tripartite tricarboxylate transporter substrate-binding protein [Roseateles sp.]|nr:tripartite tricarboxylate transporter substrate-binding protein [Roseateles sp.]